MRKLPGAGDAKHDELDNDPSNDTGVCRLGLISELGLSFLCTHSQLSGLIKRHVYGGTYTLEYLFSADISKTSVEVLDT